jgi:NNP family nitrate/nitrite transporter-like MFS transporter
MGGLGGFFPPLVLGAVKQHMGSYNLGFVLLTVFCVLCLVLCYEVFLARGRHVDERALAGAGS